MCTLKVKIPSICFKLSIAISEISDNYLTGNIISKVIDADAKAQYIHKLCAQYGFEKNQVVAEGDGTNDLEMMKIAGLSVAYHAKPLLQKNCDVDIKYGGLDTIIDFSKNCGAEIPSWILNRLKLYRNDAKV